MEWAEWAAEGERLRAEARAISGPPSYIPEDEADATAEAREQGLWPVGPAEGEEVPASRVQVVASGVEVAASRVGRAPGHGDRLLPDGLNPVNEALCFNDWQVAFAHLQQPHDPRLVQSLVFAVL